jgi:hypothetical protein
LPAEGRAADRGSTPFENLIDRLGHILILRNPAMSGPDTGDQRRRVGSPSGQRTVVVWSLLSES